MTDIFLSYTERDRDTARRVAEALGSAGWSVWWDRRIPAGETWRSVLEHALEEMRCMVVLWSTKSIESEWVYEEASEGRRRGKLVPVMIEAVRPPAGFREIQAADLTGWDGAPDFEGLHMLLADLEQLLGKPASRTANTGLPYNPTDLPGGARHVAQDAGARWPLRALAGTALLAGAVAVIGLSSRPKATNPAPAPTPAVIQPDPGTPPAVPAAAPAAPSPTTVIAPSDSTDISRDARTAAAPPTAPLSVNKTRSAPSTPIQRSDPASLSSVRCADLLARIQLGETLSEASQSRFDKECRP